MITTRIAELVAYLSSEEVTEDALCQFLIENTLNHLEIQGVFISEVTSRRTVRSRASFGIDQSHFAEWQEFPLDWKLPVTDALVEKRIVWVGSLPEWPSEYPRISDVKFAFPVRTFIVTPIHRMNNTVACFGIFSKIDITPDEETDLLLQTVAHVISLLVFRQGRDRRKTESTSVTALSDRQLQILAYIAEKKTNIEIADLMGYSESTIRQETIRIFDKLKVSGRNEARNYFMENREKLGFRGRGKNDVPSSREEFAH